MMKIAWELISKPQYLWVQAMRAKYKCGSSIILDVIATLNASNTWRGVSVWQDVVENVC